MRYGTILKLDRERTVRYGFKALSALEEELGVPVMKIGNMLDDLNMKGLATIIWAGLIHEDRELSVDDVIDLLDEHMTLKEVMEAVQEALNAAFESGNTGNKKGGKGKNS